MVRLKNTCRQTRTESSDLHQVSLAWSEKPAPWVRQKASASRNLPTPAVVKVWFHSGSTVLREQAFLLHTKKSVRGSIN